MTPSISGPTLDPWRLSRAAPFLRHDVEPIYLANGCFGGLQSATGTEMDLWSSSIGARNATAPNHPVIYPVTLLRSRVFYQTPHFRRIGFHVGRDGMVTGDPRYTANPSMPHLPQLYQISQSLDLQSGVAGASGVIYPGTLAGFEAGLRPERQIPYEIRTVFLKDSTWMAMEIVSDDDTEILFAPEWRDEELLGLHARSGIHRLGSPIDCDIRLRQQTLAPRCSENGFEVDRIPEGGIPYTWRIQVPDANLESFQGRPAMRGRGRMTVFLELRIANSRAEVPFSDMDGMLEEQRLRWAAFWSRSRVDLPVSESLWQQRYHASLFYLEQSVGDGPTFPGGLSRPNLPHWFGCFHDTDTYFCRALLESGRFEAPGRHLAYRQRTLPRAKELATEKGYLGALIPFQTDANGEGSRHLSPAHAAIVAVEAATQYLHTRDPDRLSAVQEILENSFALLTCLLEPDGDPPRLVDRPVPTFSETMAVSSPTEAVLAVRAVARHLADLFPHSSWTKEARRVLEELHPPRHPDGGWGVCAEDDPEYMRCPSVTLGSFPLEILPPGPDLAASFDREMASIVFHFAWLPHQSAVVAARLGRGEGPLSAPALLRGTEGFYREWHAYDEWENRRTGRCDHFVTAAGGFCIALHHMLLTETAPGEWSLFPAIPADWNNLTFENLVTRAGWRVSAELKGGHLVRLECAPLNNAAAEVFSLRGTHPGPALSPGVTMTDQGGWIWRHQRCQPQRL